MAQVAIIGSSYISRLEKICKGDLKIPGVVGFFVVPGLRADNIPQLKIEEINKFGPDIVIIFVGGNDISDNPHHVKYLAIFQDLWISLKKTYVLCMCVKFLQEECSNTLRH